MDTLRGMEQFATPFDCDSAPRPILIRTVNCPPRLTVPPHSHLRAELVYVRSGAVWVTVDDKIVTAPSQNAILIPQGSTHSMRMLRESDLMTAYIAMPPDDLYKECRPLRVSNLLRELISAAADLPVDYTPDSRDSRIMELLLDEVTWLLSQPSMPTLEIPVPKDPRLLRLCRESLQELDRNWTLDDAAKSAGMGRRTFTRTFRREVGCSFSTWRLRTRLNAAICRLNAGVSITDIALEVGYSNPGAFATTFRQHLGMSPSDYQTTRVQTRFGLESNGREMSAGGVISGGLVVPSGDSSGVLERRKVFATPF